MPKANGWFLFLMLIFSATACKKFKMEANVPECIQEKAKRDTKSVKSVYASILEYEFQSGLVYVFDLEAGNVDSRAEIYKSDCSYLGYLGGIDGNRVVNSEDFSNAVFKRKVWPLKN